MTFFEIAPEKGGSCWHCGKALTQLDYGRSDTCQTCGKDTRTCKGCHFYEESSARQCHENQADLVINKEKANFCDYFQPTHSHQTGSSFKTQATLQAAAENLFQKKK